MKYIENIKKQRKILSEILNDNYEYVGGISGYHDGMGGILGQKWYKNPVTKKGIIIDYCNNDIESIRIAKPEEFSEFCDRFDGTCLAKGQKTR